MWKCPTCGDQIDDQFDSCWQCTKPAPAPAQEPPGNRRTERSGVGFWCAWRRGLVVLLMTLVYIFVSAVAISPLIMLGHHPLGAVALLGVVIFILPPLAYFIFVLFFGRHAYPVPQSIKAIPREERANALVDEATTLEARGRVKEALDTYQSVVDEFHGTTASLDAQKSIESLRAKIVNE
jgi:hypothetical protein